MTENFTQLTVQNEMVVTMAYTLKVNGEIVDTSDDTGPIQFIQGSGQVLPALEKELYGMKVGDTKQVSLPAIDGYGELDPEAYSDIPRSEFPSQIPLKPGIELELKDQDGRNHYAVIQSVDDNNVHVNLNHPLAGKDLDFSVRVVALRTATPEEMEHGHTHEEGDHG